MAAAAAAAVAAAGLEQQAAGAVLKSAHERTSGGSNGRSAYLNAGRLSMSGGEGGARTRPRASADTRGGGNRGTAAAFGRGPPGADRDPAAQTSPSLFGSMPGLRGPHAATSASSSYAAGAGVGLASSPAGGPQYDTNSFRGPSQREQLSRGGGGGDGGERLVRHASRSPAAPPLDLDELIMSGHDDGSSRSEWDDFLASMSMPPRQANDGLGHSESPHANQG